MYKAIIFDFFDVIHKDPYKAWLSKHNIRDRQPYDSAMEMVDRGNVPVAEFHRRAHELSGHSLESIERDFNNNHILDEKMIPFIKDLSKRYRIGLMSNAGSEEVRPLIEEHAYDRLFHEISISGETGLIKPNPEAFHHILDKLECAPEGAIFIDDSPKNIAGAAAIGITGVLYKNLPQLKAYLEALGIQT